MSQWTNMMKKYPGYVTEDGHWLFHKHDKDPHQKKTDCGYTNWHKKKNGGSMPERFLATEEFLRWCPDCFPGREERDPVHKIMTAIPVTVNPSTRATYLIDRLKKMEE